MVGGIGAEPTESFDVFADEEGRFVADLTPIRLRTAQARMEGAGCRAHAPGFGMREGTEIFDLPFHPEQPCRGTAKLVLEPCATFTGRVVDGSGRPVAGATIESQEVDGNRNPEGASSPKYEGTLEKNTLATPCFVSGRIEIRGHAVDVGVSPWVALEVRAEAASSLRGVRGAKKSPGRSRGRLGEVSSLPIGGG